MHSAVFALGSNLGNRLENLKLALSSLKRLPQTTVEGVSSVYETEPVGTKEKQNLYLNCCASLETNLNSEILLGCFLGVEASMGRKRTYKNAPRTIDIDLIFFDDLKLNKEHLTIPHPRWQERKFVILPILDLFKEGKFKSINVLDALKKAPSMVIKKYCSAQMFLK